MASEDLALAQVGNTTLPFLGGWAKQRILRREDRWMDVQIAGVPLPPQDLIIMEKDPEKNRIRAREMARHIDKLVGIGTGLLFDLGCGWGRAAYGLLDTGFSGRYVGFDLLPKQIEWLSANFTPKHPNYRFHYVEMKGGFSHENTGKKTTDISKIVSEPVETAIALSVFTHVYEETVLDYTRQVYELLAPGRFFVFTAFLLNNESRLLIEQGKSTFTMKERVNDHCFFNDPNAPRNAIAYSEDFLLSAVGAQGYQIDRLVLGNWCGRDRTSHPEGQDWIVARKPL
jgi:SAM-dependent methyltransferase